mmetsp:Transcript_15692/g.21515  ORF Transcript_15692/g.21515 Transcript_15692/m.21515 type:complete len:168 (-) Transcript_15692:354-857(-)
MRIYVCTLVPLMKMFRVHTAAYFHCYKKCSFFTHTAKISNNCINDKPPNINAAPILGSRYDDALQSFSSSSPSPFLPLFLPLKDRICPPKTCPPIMKTKLTKKAQPNASIGVIPTTPPATPPAKLFNVIGMAKFNIIAALPSLFDASWTNGDVGSFLRKEQNSSLDK